MKHTKSHKTCTICKKILNFKYLVLPMPPNSYKFMRATGMQHMQPGTELECLSMGAKYNSKIKSRLTPFNSAN